MPRGRPVKSHVRDNIIELLFFLKQAYGYDIHKNYVEFFPKTSLRNIYYQIKKGVALEEIEVEKIEQVAGDYSWGNSAEKIFYKLGPNAKPKMNPELQKFLKEKELVD